MTPIEDDVTDSTPTAGLHATLHNELAAAVNDILDVQLPAVESRRLDQVPAPTSAVALNTQKITDLADPTNPQDAATLAFTIAQALGAVSTDAATRRVRAMANYPIVVPEATDDGRWARALADIYVGGAYQGWSLKIDNDVSGGAPVPWNLTTHIDITQRVTLIADGISLFNQNTWGHTPCFRIGPLADGTILPVVDCTNTRGDDYKLRYRNGSQMWGTETCLSCCAIVCNAANVRIGGVFAHNSFAGVSLQSTNTAGTLPAPAGTYKSNNYIGFVVTDGVDFGLIMDGQDGFRCDYLGGTYTHTVPGITGPPHLLYVSNIVGNRKIRINTIDCRGRTLGTWSQTLTASTGYAGSWTLTPWDRRGTLDAVSNSPNVTVSSTAWANGDDVLCAAFAAGTTVLSGGGTTSLVLSNNAIGTGLGFRAYVLSSNASAGANAPISLVNTDTRATAETKINAHASIVTLGGARVNGGNGTEANGYNLPMVGTSTGLAITFTGLPAGSEAPPLMKIDTSGLTAGTVSISRQSAGGTAIIKRTDDIQIQRFIVDGGEGILGAGSDVKDLVVGYMDARNITPGATPISISGHRNRIVAGKVQLLGAVAAITTYGINCDIKLDIKTAWTTAGETNQGSLNQTFDAIVGGDHPVVDLRLENLDPTAAAPINISWDASNLGVSTTTFEGGTEVVAQRGGRVTLREVRPGFALTKSPGVAPLRSTVEPDILYTDPKTITQLSAYREVVSAAVGTLFVRRASTSPVIAPGAFDTLGSLVSTWDIANTVPATAALVANNGRGARVVVPFAATLADLSYNVGGPVTGATATITPGSASLTLVSPTTGWINGMAVAGSGATASIPAGATILSGAGTATMVMSAPATGSAPAAAAAITGTPAGNMVVSVFGGMASGSRLIRWTSGPFAVPGTAGWKDLHPNAVFSEGEVIEAWVGADNATVKFLRVVTNADSLRFLSPDLGLMSPVSTGGYPLATDTPPSVADGGVRPCLQLHFVPV